MRFCLGAGGGMVFQRNWNPFCDISGIKFNYMPNDKQKDENEQPVEQPVDENAERYLKEPGSIEDVPSAEEQEQAEEELKKEQ
jgi:hypothetical protein